MYNYPNIIIIIVVIINNVKPTFKPENQQTDATHPLSKLFTSHMTKTKDPQTVKLASLIEKYYNSIMRLTPRYKHTVSYNK